MTTEEKICPYPGLRPFNEDESIFFKGRDEHIEQIVKQLEEKKFLMLTGASGDGKSSLVYAGVIPNARAGFFKAKFNNWIVADFRPERTPLANMSQAINQQLKINDVAKVEKELSYGFSALIDLYKKSNYWVNQQSAEFLSLNLDEQKKTKRKGANLLILVDQFEEFFTNPENYSNGKTSLYSQAVVNLLLETTRLAIEQDLPIYIVCTMRSDYIGQCASFRGLPEYIGYSQFFVPRLKRKEIYQVIEEPALLSGNKISKRLVEMLINEMNDGIDQLPVLQHALNQIWQKADKGNAEMDLIHFAKINGIPKNQLSQKDKTDFETWFDTLPEFKKHFFANSSLGDVLDAHANELFETANSGTEISLEQSKKIIETTFKCLTKIDEARSVRNRMTLEEVTQIINDEKITTSGVAKTLFKFRIQGTTFLKPFVEEKNTFAEKHDSSLTLSPNAVLDITHESLIRNWNLLSEWAKQEHENFVTWQDFNKQLHRWLHSQKSSGYLLPIGPLTFFENWFNTAKANKYWLARYDEREISKAEKINEAEETINNAKQFIKRSANRLFFSRTVLKYGADKLIAAFGILLLIFSCTYFYFDAKSKENGAVILEIEQKANELLKSKFIKPAVKADYILVEERLHPDIYKKLLERIGSDSVRTDVMINMFSKCIDYQEKNLRTDSANPLLEKLFWDIASLESKENLYRFINKTNAQIKNHLRNTLSLVYGHMLMQRSNFKLKDEQDYENLRGCYFVEFIELLKDTNSLKSFDTWNFAALLQAMPEITTCDSVKVQKIINEINPFAVESKRKFDILFPKEKTVKFSDGDNDNMSHNAGYYQLANLFALAGDFKNLNLCLDTLIKYNLDFYKVYSGYTFDFLIESLILNGKLYTEQGEKFITKIEANNPKQHAYGIEYILLNRFCANLKNECFIDRRSISNFINQNCYDLQVQRNLLANKSLYQLANWLIKKENNKWVTNTPVISYDGLGNSYHDGNKISENQKNYMLAMLYKTKAFLFNQKENFNLDSVNDNLHLALISFYKLGQDFLQVKKIGLPRSEKSYISSNLFKYPILCNYSGWEPYSEDQLELNENNVVFLNSINEHHNLQGFYFKHSEDAKTLNIFLINYFANVWHYSNYKQLLNPKIFETEILNNTLPKEIDKDALLVYCALYYHYKSNPKLAAKYAAMINVKELLNKEKIFKDAKNYCYSRIAKDLANYYFKISKVIIEEDGAVYNYYDSIANNNYKKGFEVLNSFPEAFQKRNAYLEVIDSLQSSNLNSQAYSVLDSLFKFSISKTPRFGAKLFEILGRNSANATNELSLNLLKDKADAVKSYCFEKLVSGISYAGNYYEAFKIIPDNISSTSQLKTYNALLKNEILLNRIINKNGWTGMDVKVEKITWGLTPYEDWEGESVMVATGD